MLRFMATTAPAPATVHRRRRLDAVQAPRRVAGRALRVRRHHHRHLLPARLPLAAAPPRARAVLRHAAGRTAGRLPRLPSLPSRPRCRHATAIGAAPAADADRLRDADCGAGRHIDARAGRRRTPVGRVTGRGARTRARGAAPAPRSDARHRPARAAERAAARPPARTSARGRRRHRRALHGRVRLVVAAVRARPGSARHDARRLPSRRRRRDDWLDDGADAAGPPAGGDDGARRVRRLSRRLPRSASGRARGRVPARDHRRWRRPSRMGRPQRWPSPVARPARTCRSTCRARRSNSASGWRCEPFHAGRRGPTPSSRR